MNILLLAHNQCTVCVDQSGYQINKIQGRIHSIFLNYGHEVTENGERYTRILLHPERTQGFAADPVYGRAKCLPMLGSLET